MKKVIDIDIRLDSSDLLTLKKTLDLAKQSLKDATDPKYIKALNSEIEKVEGTLRDLNVEVDEFSLGAKFEDVYNDVKPLTSRLGELEDRMYELAFAGKANTEEFKALQTEAITMRSTIIEVDKQVDILADNKGLSVFSTGIQDVGSSLLRLDFQTASKQAAQLATAAKGITFAQAIGSLKDLGSTFVSLGKALLTNPIFILATVVTAIAIGVYKLLDSLGLVEPIVKAIGAAIDGLIQAFKDLLDWFGFTDYAAEESARIEVEANNRKIKSLEKLENARRDELDHQLQIMSIQGATVTEMAEYEKQKIKDLDASIDKRMELEQERSAKMLELYGIESDEYQETRKKMEEMDQQRLDNVQRYEILIATINKEAIDKSNKTKEDQEQKDKERAARAVSRANEISQAQIAADRLIEDLKIDAIENQDLRELQRSRLAIERSIEEIDRDKLTKAQVLALELSYFAQLENLENEYYDNLRVKNEEYQAEQEEIRQREEERAKTKYEALRTEYYNYYNEIALDEEEKAILEFETEMTRFRELLEAKAVTQEEFDELTRLREKQLSDDIIDIKTKETQAINALKTQQLTHAQSYATSLNNLAQAVFITANRFGKQDEKNSEARAKKQFKIQKGLQLGMAIIDAAKAITSSLAIAPVAIGPIPNPAGIASLALAISSSVASIAKISSQQYTPGSTSGGSSPSAPNVNVPALNVGEATSIAPDLNLFGEGYDKNNQNAGSEENINVTVDARVVESEMTDAQKRAKAIKYNGEL